MDVTATVDWLMTFPEGLLLVSLSGLAEIDPVDKMIISSSSDDSS
jgi:hypothetical protein